MRAKLRLGHFSRRTEAAYVNWVSRFVKHHELRHPREMSEREVVTFLTFLAVDRGLALRPSPTRAPRWSFCTVTSSIGRSWDSASCRGRAFPCVCPSC